MRRMKHVLGFGLGIWVVSAVAAAPVGAQCAFSHGQNTGTNGWSRMVQTFVNCGGVGGQTPNTTTAGGFPSCGPPITAHQQAGSPANGWVLDTITGRARIKLDQLAGPTDVRIRMQLRDTRDGTGIFPVVGATGSLFLIVRLTFDDTAGGDMTVIDMPLSTPVVITTATGDANVNTTVNAVLLAIAQPPLPTCSSLELIDAYILDPASSEFLRIGHFHS